MSPARLALLATACSFEPPGLALPDGARLADGPLEVADAPAADGRADAVVLPPFRTPAAELDTGDSDDDPSLTADQLEIFFGSYYGAPDEDIFWGQRQNAAAPFTEVYRLTALSAISNNDTTMKVAGADGLTIVFTRTVPTAHLWISTRPSRGSAAWTEPAALSELDGPNGEWSPFLMPDDRTLIYCSRVDDVMREEIFVSTRTGPGASFGTPIRLASLSSDADECDAMMPTPDVIYFSRLYAGSTTDTDIFVAERTTGWEFAPPRRLDELVTTGHDRDPWVTPDQQTIWFASDRGGAMDLWVATR